MLNSKIAVVLFGAFAVAVGIFLRLHFAALNSDGWGYLVAFAAVCVACGFAHAFAKEKYIGITFYCFYGSLLFLIGWCL